MSRFSAGGHRRSVPDFDDFPRWSDSRFRRKLAPGEPGGSRRFTHHHVTLFSKQEQRRSHTPRWNSREHSLCSYECELPRATNPQRFREICHSLRAAITRSHRHCSLFCWRSSPWDKARDRFSRFSTIQRDDGLSDKDGDITGHAYPFRDTFADTWWLLDAVYRLTIMVWFGDCLETLKFYLAKRSVTSNFFYH